MTNRLKSYMKKTILASATEGAYPAKRRTKESTYSAFRDASQGTDTGWWNDLIYTVDVIDMFNKYRSDVAEAIKDYLDNTGQSASEPVTPRDPTTFADMLVACTGRVTWADYNNGDNPRKQDRAIAGSIAIRFAIEYLISDVAYDCGVEL
jgi:hypothetical protein